MGIDELKFARHPKHFLWVDVTARSVNSTRRIDEKGLIHHIGINSKRGLGNES